MGWLTELFFALNLCTSLACHHRRGYSKEEISELLINSIDAEKIRANLHEFTREMHIGGSDGAMRLADLIKDKYTQYGLEDMKFHDYYVLLSYPDYDKPNNFLILDADGEEVYASKGNTSAVFPNEQGDWKAGFHWFAYSPGGKVDPTDVVYVNYGSDEDFKKLEKLEIDFTGKIVLARNGGASRMLKVYNAQERGAVGILIFSDPAQVAPDGIDKENVYPKTQYMPPDAVEVGTILFKPGDPLSPLMPAKTHFYNNRTLEEAQEAKIIPSIPALPISYAAAKEILSHLTGGRAADSFQGDFNLTYNTGPGFDNGGSLTFEVHNNYENKTIRNIVGYIHGAEEPDKYVIIGNHYDAWTYGSVDPNSATAIMAEVVRAFTNVMKETGWRPARTIMFIHWDASEYGMIGSTEFVEEFSDILSQRAVVYINMDALFGNLTFRAAGPPTVHDVIWDVAKLIRNPHETEFQAGRETIYETWQHYSRNASGKPPIEVPAMLSDFAPFIFYLGIPIVDFSYRNKLGDDVLDNLYSLYHTLYETPFLNEQILDRKFTMSRGLGQFWVELTRRFADSDVLPLKASHFARTIREEFLPAIKGSMTKLDKTEAVFQQHEYLLARSDEFVEAAEDFELRMANADKKSISRFSDRLMRVDRCFINPQFGTIKEERHVIYSRPNFELVNAEFLPVIMTLIEQVHEQQPTNFKERASLVRELTNQLSIFQYSVHCAIKTLQELI